MIQTRLFLSFNIIIKRLVQSSHMEVFLLLILYKYNGLFLKIDEGILKSSFGDMDCSTARGAISPTSNPFLYIVKSNITYLYLLDGNLFIISMEHFLAS